MAKVDILDWDKKKVGQIELDAAVFEQPVKKDVLHTLVKWQLASRRSGTHKAKSKGEVRGGGKKPFKQKGTGSARQGSSRSPLNPGGGVAFGPKPRNYSYSVPKKIKQLGLKSALSYLFSNEKLFVIDEMSSSEGKTKELAARLKNFGLNKVVLIDGNVNQKMTRASRNLETCRYYTTAGLNVYDLLKYDAAIVSKNSLEGIAARCGLTEQAEK
ncbi:MAG: 50S ribosomal protein L4 [Bdellovibrionales bacterium]|nr:50S ribosomal protein L4 [Bdellovibrionales bacterium]